MTDRFGRLLIFVTFIAYSVLLKAQVPNDSLEYRIRPDASRYRSLFLSVENFNFLRNYEFYNKFQDGYTLYGTQLTPQFTYYADSNLVLSGGVYLRKDFGTTGVDDIQPLFSLKYRKNAVTLVAGALESTINHRFIEPVFDVEKRITDPVAYGTQLLVESKAVFLDAFINWRKMIYKPSPEQEEILAGLSSDLTVAGSSRFRFSIPLQATVFHKGGQIDTTGKPLQTLANLAAGFRLSFTGPGFIREFNTENFVATFSELSPTRLQPFRQGNAVYLNARVKAGSSLLGLSYWKAKGFNAPMGMPVFQSVSAQINYPGYSERNRSLLFIRYAFQKKLLPHLWVDFRAEPVFDLGRDARMDFFHSLFLVYRQDFKVF